MKIYADKYVVVNENLIPTGELRPVEGTPMDFTTMHTIGERIDQVEGGYDHTYVLNNKGQMDKVAVFSHPDNGRAVEVYTSEPGIQFYSGNFLDGKLTGKDGIIYHKHHGFCLETQHFPDSPNQPDFPSTILRPGDEYAYTTIYKFITTE
jgi:aldose 1-epimerase